MNLFSTKKVSQAGRFMERWDILAPWCQLLKGRVHVFDTWPSTGVWNTQYFVGVEMPKRSDLQNEEQFRVAFQKTREALALLAAVAYVDYEAWRYLLEHHCGAYVGREGEEEFENVQARFGVTLDLSAKVHPEQPDEVDFDIVWLCGVHQRDHASREYLEMLQKIADMDKRLQGSKKGVEIQIPVQPMLARTQWELPADMQDVVRAERIIEQQWREYRSNQRLATGSLRCTFVLQPMQIDFNDKWTNAVVRTEFADIVERLIRSSTMLSVVHHETGLGRDFQLDRDQEHAAKKAVGQLMRSVFDSTRRSPRRASMAMTNRFVDGFVVQESQSLQVGIADIGANELTPDFYLEGLGSAMVLNQTTKRISLQFDDSPSDPLRSRFWFKWIAYGLFSRRALAHSAWEKLVLSVGDLNIEAVEAFSAIVNAEHPEGELCGRPRGQINEKDATLMDGAPIRWRFAADGEPIADSDLLIAPSAIQFVRTFSDDGSSQWIDVIVPGFGRCQVRRSDLTFQHNCRVNVPDPPRLKSLVVEFFTWEDSIWDGLPNFLATIGPLLRSLTLLGARDDLDDTVIFQHCPHLEELWLGGGWIDVMLNFTDYRARGGSLSELPSTNWHDIDALSATLCSLDSPIAKCVRKLRVRLKTQWTGWTELHHDYEPRGYEADLKPLLQIITANQNLEYFDISVPEEYHGYMSDFRQYHLEALPRAREPLSLDSKIAFLSVFSSDRSFEPDTKKLRGVSTPPREPAQEALSIIFAFAAPSVRRRVYFHL